MSDKEKNYSFNTNSPKVPESSGIELNMMTINEGRALDTGGENENKTFSFNVKDDGCESDTANTYESIADSPKTKNNNAHDDHDLNNSPSVSVSQFYNKVSGKPSDMNIKENVVNHENVTFIRDDSRGTNFSVEDGVASQNESGTMPEGNSLLHPPVVDTVKRMNSTNSTGNYLE
jgi:hypothetical protein